MSDWRDLLPHVALDVVSPVAIAPDASAETLAAAALGRAGIQAFLDGAAAAAAPLTIVVNDPHRFTDTASVIAVLMALLDARPAPARPRLRLLVAAGSHRSSAGERAAHEARMLGPFAGRIAEGAWHDARDAAVHRRVGAHVLHAWMAEGGHYLGCGSMEPHYFAGVTGAHKTLTVGVMAMESLAANHAHAMSPDAAGLRLDGNPVHAGIVDAVHDLEASGARLLAVNQLVVDGRVVACTAGPPLAALAEGVPLVRRAFGRALGTPLDLVVARVHPPLDRDLYQADKGIKNTEAVVADGGGLILEADCAHGVGLDQFVELLRAAPTHARALAVVRARGYRLGDHKAVRLRALTDARGVRLCVVARGLDPTLSAVLGAAIVPDRRAAAAWAARTVPRATRGVVVEDAGNLSLTLE